MALTIEDGSLVSGADSYASAADLVTFAAEYGHTIASTEAEQEILLRSAMQAMEGRNWKGHRVNNTQDLSWPRVGVYVDRQLLVHTSIPRQLFYGQLNLAVEAHTVDLLPLREANPKGPVIEERIEGAITEKFANTGKVHHTPASSKAEILLRQLENRAGLCVIRA